MKLKSIHHSCWGYSASLVVLFYVVTCNDLSKKEQQKALKIERPLGLHNVQGNL